MVIGLLLWFITACNCSIVGSDPNSLYQCNSISGNCTCKIYVQGRSCDTCQNGFWNLDSLNPFGCRGISMPV